MSLCSRWPAGQPRPLDPDEDDAQGFLTAKGSGVGPHIEQKMEAVGQRQGGDPKKPKEASHSDQAGAAKLR